MYGHLINLWYPQERLAVSSASKGINEQIQTAIFSKTMPARLCELYCCICIVRSIVLKSFHLHQLIK